MRNLPVVILVLIALFVAMVAGCGGKHYDGRLVAADSLIRSHRDSALSVMFDLSTALNEILAGGYGKALVNELIASQNIVTIEYHNTNLHNDIYDDNSTLFGDNGAHTILWNSGLEEGGLHYDGLFYSNKAPSYIILSHELAHVQDSWRGTIDFSPWFLYNGIVIGKSEIYACNVENQIRFEHNLPMRTHYAYYIFGIGGFQILLPFEPSRLSFSFVNKLISFNLCVQ